MASPGSGIRVQGLGFGWSVEYCITSVQVPGPGSRGLIGCACSVYRTARDEQTATRNPKTQTLNPKHGMSTQQS
jgi:hypothetical protein